MKHLETWLMRSSAVRDSILLGSGAAIVVLSLALFSLWHMQQHWRAPLQAQQRRIQILKQQVHTLKQQRSQQQQQLSALAAHHWLRPDWHVLLQLAEQSNVQVVHFTQVDSSEHTDHAVASFVLQGHYNALLQWLQTLANTTAGLTLSQWQMQPLAHNVEQLRLKAMFSWALAKQLVRPDTGVRVVQQQLTSPFRLHASNHAISNSQPWKLVGTMQLGRQALALFSVGEELVSRKTGSRIGRHGQYRLIKINDQTILLNRQDKDVFCHWHIGGAITCATTSQLSS